VPRLLEDCYNFVITWFIVNTSQQLAWSQGCYNLILHWIKGMYNIYHYGEFMMWWNGFQIFQICWAVLSTQLKCATLHANIITISLNKSTRLKASLTRPRTTTYIQHDVIIRGMTIIGIMVLTPISKGVNNHIMIFANLKKFCSLMPLIHSIKNFTTSHLSLSQTW